MKPTLALVLFFITTLSIAQDFSIDSSFEEEIVEAPKEIETLQKNNWITNLAEAKTIAKRDKKLILLYFTGSDWCTPCVALKKDFFETDEFAKYEDKFVMVYIDRPRRIDIITPEQLAYNKKIIAKYKTTSFPRMMILDSGGNKKGELSGYSSFNTYQDTSHHFNLVKKYASL
jgi:thioredoxin-related protein